MFNHACCPNTLRINRGRVSYMVAKHTIMPGEEVIDTIAIMVLHQNTWKVDLLDVIHVSICKR